VCNSFQHRFIQLPESLGGHRRQEIFPIREVPVRSVVGDAGTSCDFPQSKASRADFGDQLNCRL
jgi:hypothetical protein